MSQTLPPPLLDHDSAQRWFRGHLSQYFPGASDVVLKTLERFGSVQANRGIIRYQLLLRYPKKTMVTTVYGNMGPNKDVAVLWKTFEFLWQHGFNRPPLMSPRPLAYISTQHLFLYEEFPGFRVRDAMEKKSISFGRLKNIVGLSACWLRKLHALRPTTGVTRSPKINAQDVRDLVAAHHIDRDVVRIINSIITSAPSTSLLQGDPHLANCIAGPRGRLAVIDYSEAHRGHPYEDVGMYLAHLDVALRGHMTERRAAEIRQFLVVSYLEKSFDRLSKGQRQLLLAFRARSALNFLHFTTNIHRQSSPYVRWMTARWTKVIRDTVREIPGSDPQMKW